MKEILILLLVLTGCMETKIPEVASKAAEEAVIVINDAKNTTLSITDCNIGDMSPMTIEYGDTVLLCEVKDKADTIVLNGDVSTKNITLYKGPIHIPFNNTIKFDPNCNWVDSLGNRLIYPIEFDANVNDWKR